MKIKECPERFKGKPLSEKVYWAAWISVLCIPISPFAMIYSVVVGSALFCLTLILSPTLFLFSLLLEGFEWESDEEEEED